MKVTETEWLLWLGTVGFATLSVYMTVLYWLLRAKCINTKNAYKQTASRLERALHEIGQLHIEKKEHESLKTDSDMLRAQYALLATKYENTTATAFRYKDQRRKSDDALLERNKDVEALRDYIDRMIPRNTTQ